METRLTSKNKEASKQVLVKENNDPEEGRGGGRGGGVEDTLETPEPGGAQAAPSRFPSAPSLLGTKFGAAPPREPGRGRGGRGGPSIPGAASREGFAPRPGALLSAAPGPRGCAPRPPPHRGGSHLCPGAGAGGRGGSARPRPSAAPRRARLQPAPRRSARHSRGGGGEDAPRRWRLSVCAPPSLPTCGAGAGVPGRLRRRGGPGGGDPQHPGLGRGGGTLSRAPARACRGRPARGEPPRSAPRPPRAPPGPRCPALRPHVGAAAGPAAAAAPPLAAAAPDRPGEICQQFAATLVITFLESAAIDVKIRELPRLSAWNNLFAATYSSS